MVDITDFIETGILIVTQDNFNIVYSNKCYNGWFPNTPSGTSISNQFPEFKKDLASKRIKKYNYYNWESPSFQIGNETIRLLFSFKPFQYYEEETYIVEVKNDTRSLEKEILLSQFTRQLEEKNNLLEIANKSLIEEKRKVDELLLNILPANVAAELKRNGKINPIYFEHVTVLFTDFQGFTNIAEKLAPHELVNELDRCFSYFDSLMDRYKLEKLKTIGDAFMCAGGLPLANKTNPVDAILAAIEIQAFMNQMKEIKEIQNLPYWEIRLGIHTGPLVAGIIGEKKFQYDMWGDTVNTASRCESSGIAGKINISSVTFSAAESFFDCEYRGKIPAKNKGEIEMYLVNGIIKGLSKNGDGKTPNEKFWDLYNRL